MEKISFAVCNPWRSAATLERNTMITTLKTSTIEERGVNAILRGVEAELGSLAVRRGRKLKTLVMGGEFLNDTSRGDLARFACEKNWDILYVAMNPERPNDTLAACEIEVAYFATDGLDNTAVMVGGRLWKRNGQEAARLLFPRQEMEIKAKANGLFSARAIKAQYQDDGFYRARDAIQRRMANDRSSLPVQTTIGASHVVYDIQTMLRLLKGE